jgi:hypothetical protein
MEKLSQHQFELNCSYVKHDYILFIPPNLTLGAQVNDLMEAHNSQRQLNFVRFEYWMVLLMSNRFESDLFWENCFHKIRSFLEEKANNAFRCKFSEEYQKCFWQKVYVCVLSEKR